MEGITRERQAGSGILCLVDNLDWIILCYGGGGGVALCFLGSLAVSLGLPFLGSCCLVLFRFFSSISRTSLVAEVVKSLPAMQDTCVRSLGQEDSPGEGNGNPLQDSRVEYSMDRGAWWAISVGSQRVEHNSATEQDTTVLSTSPPGYSSICFKRTTSVSLRKEMFFR